MPRTVSASTQTETAKVVTKPITLVELDFVPPLYLSTHGDREWNSITWVSSDVRVDGPRLRSDGEQDGRLTFFRDDDLYTKIFDVESEERVCKIYHLYGDGPYAIGDATQIFEGSTDGAEATETHITIDYSSGDGGTSLSPRLFLGQITRHITPPGTKITWDGEIVIVSN